MSDEQKRPLATLAEARKGSSSWLIPTLGQKSSLTIMKPVRDELLGFTGESGMLIADGTERGFLRLPYSFWELNVRPAAEADKKARGWVLVLKVTDPRNGNRYAMDFGYDPYRGGIGIRGTVSAIMREFNSMKMFYEAHPRPAFAVDPGRARHLPSPH